MAGGKLPQGYLNEALRAHLDPYHADEQARERVGEACEAWMAEAARRAGNLARARSELEADAEDGMRFVLVRGLCSRSEVEAYRTANPMFRP